MTLIIGSNGPKTAALPWRYWPLLQRARYLDSCTHYPQRRRYWPSCFGAAGGHNSIELGGPQMTSKIVDFGAIREDKAKGLANYFEHMDRVGQRQQIMAEAIEEMHKFSTSAEIAKTLRFVLDFLEG